MKTPATVPPVANPPLTLKEVKRLKVGDRLTWDHTEAGEVVEVGYLGARIKWAEGQLTTLLFADIKGDVSEVMERLAKIRMAAP